MPTSHVRSTGGFTLIEVLVVATITLLITGAGIAAFFQFNERQQVLTTAQGFQTFLRSAQVKAKAGERPTADCTILVGYRVVVDAATQQARFGAVCDGYTDNITGPLEYYTLSEPVQFTQTTNFLFKTLHGGIYENNQGGTSLTFPLNIQLRGGSRTYQVSLSAGGDIGQPVEVATSDDGAGATLPTPSIVPPGDGQSI